MHRDLIPSWKVNPFLRIVIPFLAGIYVQYQYPASTVLLVTFWITLLLLLIGNRLSIYYTRRFRREIGIAMNVLLLSAGGACMYYKHPANNPQHLLNKPLHQYGAYIVSITRDYSRRAASFRTEAEVTHTRDSTVDRCNSSKILLYFPVSDSLILPKIGSRLLVIRAPTRIPKTSNPGGFDFRRYCALKGIYFQDYLSADRYALLDVRKLSFVNRLLAGIQSHILSAIRHNVSGNVEAGLAEALMIGYKEDLDRDLLNSYSKTGVVHVIAISGLHLALIYWILDKLASISIRRSRMARGLIVISGLWLFTLLAGASPSVVRSAAMFTVIVIGSMVNKRSSLVNGLSASAFFLLCFDPFWLWDLGFQLSYAAVLSLVLFATPIYNLIYVSNMLLDQLWKSVSVTIAAQLCTLPILLYNFHQFPVYFIFTNIVCVPLSTGVLIVELLLCITTWFPVLARLLGWVVFNGISWMNASVRYFESMPMSGINGFNFQLSQACVLTIAIAGFYLFITRKLLRGCHLTLLSISIIIVLEMFFTSSASRQKLLVVYNVPGSKAVDIIEGRKASFVGDSKLLNDRSLFERNIFPSRIHFYIAPAKNNNAWHYPDGNALMTVHNRRIALINNPALPAGLKFDVCIVSGSPSLDIETLIKTCRPNIMVFDASNSRNKLNRWKSVCKRFSVKHHLTSEQGAFVLRLN